MDIIQFIINKLAGYDVLSKQEELEHSISVLEEEKSELTYSVRGLKTKLSSTEREQSNLDKRVKELELSVAEQKNKNKSLTAELIATKAIADERKQRPTLLSNQLNAYKANFTKAKRAKDELQAKYNEETERLKDELKKKENECLSLQYKLKSIQSEKVELINQIDDLNAIVALKNNEAESYNETIAKLLLDKNEFNEDVTQKEQALQSSKEEIQAIKRELECKQELLTEKEAEIERINSSLTKLQEESRQRQSSADEIRELENQIQALQEQLSDSRRDTEILTSQLEQKENEIKEIGNALTGVNERNNELQDQLDDANSTIHNHEQEIQRLNEAINSIQRSTTQITEQPTEPTNVPVQEETQEPDESGVPAFLPPADDIPNVGEKTQGSKDIEGQDESIPPVSKEPDDEPLQAQEELGETRNMHRIGARKKSKEEEVIEMSGNSMMDFPPIVNDSNKHVQRSIEYVFDKEGQKIYANDFFGGSAEEIARKSRQLEEVELMGKSDFICGMCHRPVKIAHRIINGIESLFFAHANRNEYCAWIPYSTSSKDDDIFVDELEVEPAEQEDATKPHSRVLKEMIFSLLCTPESEDLGISDVKCDAIIRSSVPYMKWRRPDISFKYKDKDVVIVLQRKKHDLRMLVDRDVFFRLNNHHVIWIFGADNDVSYDYMRQSNYKNTLFDCHRNVFVFDKEAQQKSEERNTLCVKYNWLDENDNWAITHANIGSNGLIATISDFIFDDEYCKPYIKEANEPYFRLHPDAKEQFLETRKSREQLLKEFEDKWKGEPSYEEALRMMKLRSDKATPFQYMGLWGFRFNTTTLIQPIFSEQPEDLRNGFFMVKQRGTAGLVNYYGEVVMDWTILECERLTVDTSYNRVMFLANGSWGVADFKGNVLIKPQFVAINPWSDTIYRVRMYNLWGLHNIEDQTVTYCIYDNIGELISGKAEATLRDKEKSWITYKGLLDSNGNPIDYNTRDIYFNNTIKYTKFERFGKWGLRTFDDKKVLILPSYEEIHPWTEESVRVKANGKWGVIGLPEGDVIIAINYDSIGELEDGRAKITYVGVTNIVDPNGNILSEESIKLLNGFVKSKIGGKWGIEKDREEIVPHKYDEIGSFRQRLIGVINSSIVKLNAYYDYPVQITGRCSDIVSGGIKVDISGVSCYLPNTFVKNAGLEGNVKSGHVFSNIAFGNLIFSQERYLLRFVSEAQMQKKMSHGDKDSDFNMNEIVTGTITDIMRYKTQGGKMKTTKVKLKISDGRETMVPRRFFIAVGLNITEFKKGDTIKIQKTGFDDELDQTTWQIKETTHVNP